jgi:hypothetical protein
MTPAEERLVSQGLGILDTAVKIGLGAALVVAGDLLKRGEARRAEIRQRRRERLVNPVLAFVDDLLTSIDETYWNHTEKELAEAGAERDQKERIAKEALEARLVSLRNREGAVQARVNALASGALAQSFEELSQLFQTVRRKLATEGFGAAREESRKAGEIGAKFFAVLTYVEERDPPKVPTAMRTGGKAYIRMDKNKRLPKELQ